MPTIFLFLALSFNFAQDKPVASTPPDSTNLVAIEAPKPVYPLQAREKGVQGQVWIRIKVDEQGKVESAEIESGEPVLAQAALEAYKKWKFKPFIKDGRPVKVSTRMHFDFAFQGHVTDTNPPEAQAEHSPAGDQPSADTSANNSRPRPRRVKVSQGVMEGNVAHKVGPVYPPEARRRNIQGTVILQAVIAKDGKVLDVRPISGPEELFQSSVGAVQQWRYRPYLLNGEPIEVETTIKIIYHM